MKKSVFLVAAVLLLAGGVYAVMQRPGGSPLAPVAGPGEAPAPAASAVRRARSSLEGSIVNRLAEKSLLAVGIFPREVDRVLAPLGEYIRQAKATKLWQRTQPEKQIAAELQKAASGGSFLGTWLSTDGAPQVSPVLSELWNALSEIAIALSTKTYPYERQGVRHSVPASVAVFRFSDAASWSRYSEMLRQNLETIRQKAEEQGVRMTEARPGLIELSVNVPGMSQPLTGSLISESPEISLFFGSNDRADYFQPEGTERSPAQAAAARSWIPNTAVGGVYRYDAAIDLVEMLLTSSIKEGPKRETEVLQMKKLLSLYRGATFGGFSAGMDGDAYRQISCFDLDPSKSLATIYGTMGAKTAELSLVARVANERTILGLDYPISVYQRTWQAMRDNKFLELLGADNSAQNGHAVDHFSKLVDILARFDFQTVSVIVDVPASGAVPRIAGLLGGAKIRGENLIVEFEKAINEFAALSLKAAGAGVVDAVKVTLDRSGSAPVLRIPSGHVPILGQVAGENNLVFGVEPYFIAAINERLKSNPSAGHLVKQYSSAAKDLSSAHVVFYLSSSLAFQLVKPWYRASLEKDGSVKPEEMEEIVALLPSAIISAERFEREGNTLCMSTANYGAKTP